MRLMKARQFESVFYLCVTHTVQIKHPSATILIADGADWSQK